MNIKFTINILERNNFFTDDFRAKEEIIKADNKGKLKTINIIKKQMNEIGIEEDKYKNIIDLYLKNEINPSEFTNEISKIKNKEINNF